MEMQEIPTEKEKSKDDEGASEPALEVKSEPEGKTKEEAEPDHYSKLQTPSENVYSEAYYGDAPLKTKQEDKQPEGNARLYRFGCLILALICLVLLLVVIILSVKLQNDSTLCPEKQETTTTDTESISISSSCSCEQCESKCSKLQRTHLGCQQCADGWLTYGRSCFYLSTVRLSWDESQRNCTARGASLAVITTKSVQNLLTKRGNLKYWIGLRNNGQKWTWVNGTDLQESYWAEYKSSGDCGILDSSDPPEKNWLKTSCQAYTYFICHLQY
uniref:C-type lectin domain-containing protein n=1 Tax=Anabas testudineus TaxID=64144 RepID=A0AAQ6IVW9_ANATE